MYSRVRHEIIGWSTPGFRFYTWEEKKDGEEFLTARGGQLWRASTYAGLGCVAYQSAALLDAFLAYVDA